jgi:hypothetical protein
MYVVPHGQEYQILSEHIDPAAIPKKYGGQHAYGWGDMPVLEPSIRDKLKWENGHSELPIGPIRWEQGSDGGMVAIAVGTKDDKKREEVVMKLGKNWRETFFRKDGEVSKDVGASQEAGDARKEETPVQPKEQVEPVKPTQQNQQAEQVEHVPGVQQADRAIEQDQTKQVDEVEEATQPAQAVPEQPVQQPEPEQAEPVQQMQNAESVHPVQQSEPDKQVQQPLETGSSLEDEEFFPAQETLDVEPVAKNDQPPMQGGPPVLAAAIS